MRMTKWQKSGAVYLLIMALLCSLILAGCKQETPDGTQSSAGTDPTAGTTTVPTGPDTDQPDIPYGSYTDISSHGAKVYIEAMTQLGVASGRTENEFAPDAYITRAEFVEMIALASGLSDVAYTGIYTDVTAECGYAGILQAAYDAGLIDDKLVAGGTFNGDDLITREEIASMLAAGYYLLTGKDADAEALKAFTQSDPQGNITRADAVVILFNLQDCGSKLIHSTFDEGISGWGTKIRTDTTANGYENGEGVVLWDSENGHNAKGCMLFDMVYTGKQQINAFQWDYTFASGDGSNVIEQGNTYCLTFFAKIEGAQSVNLNVVKLREKDRNDVVYSTEESATLSGEGWQLYFIELPVSVSAAEVKLIFQAGGCENRNTKIYIDDITLQACHGTANESEKVQIDAKVETAYQSSAVIYGLGKYAPQENVSLYATGKKMNGEYYLPVYWLDSTGENILSLGSAYSFTAGADTTFNVKYQKYAVKEKEWGISASSGLPKVTLSSATRSAGTVNISACVQVPEGYCAVDCGALCYPGSRVDSFTLFTEGATILSAASITAQGVYNAACTTIPSNTNALVKAYAIFRNADGNYLVVYSDEQVCRAEGQTVEPVEIDYKMIYNYEMLNCFNSSSASFPAAWASNVKKIAGTDADVITLTPSFYRANMWPSKVDTHWTEYALTQASSNIGAYERLKSYMLTGGDPLQEMIDFCRESGIENVFINYRMNDKHKTNNLDYPTHNQFYMEHPEYWLNAKSSSENRTLNYMEQEVRDYYFGLLEELCTNYDIDGLELDFERAPIFFATADIEEGTQIMTQFVGRVRAMLDEVGKAKGKYLPLSVRVCISPAASLSVGLDVAAWVRLGYIDIINASSSYYNTMAVDIEGYLAIAGDHVKVYAELEYIVDQSTKDSSARLYATAECLRSTAENFYARGVDGISVFNMDYSGDKRNTFAALTGITDLAALKNTEKHYVLNRHDLQTSGNVTTASAVMPVNSSLYDLALLRVTTGGESINDVVEVYFNGVKLEEATSICLTDETELFPRLKDSIAYFESERQRYFVLPLSIIENGENTVEVILPSGVLYKVRQIDIGIYYQDSYALKGTARNPVTGVSSTDSAGSTVVGNLLVNGDFESGKSKWTNTFKSQLSGDGEATYPTSGGVSGGYMCIDITNAGTKVGAIDFYQVMADVNITSGKTYRVTFSARVYGTDSSGVGRIWLRNNIGDAVVLGECFDIRVEGSEWKTYTADIVATQGSEGAKLLFQLGGDSAEDIQFHFDNISLVELSE